MDYEKKFLHMLPGHKDNCNGKAYAKSSQQLRIGIKANLSAIIIII